ncbi:MAG: hypothetical protein WBY94_18345 [Polyangiaceae bacterium]
MNEVNRLRVRSLMRRAAAVAYGGLALGVWACGDSTGPDDVSRDAESSSSSSGSGGSGSGSSGSGSSGSGSSGSSGGAEGGAAGSSSGDASSGDGASREDASSDGGLSDRTLSDSPSGDATANDAPVSDASEAGPDSSAGDSARDSSPDQTAADGSDAGQVTPVELCPVLDNDWSLPAADAASCATQTITAVCPDRLDSWSLDIVTDYGTGNVATDCRISSMFTLMTNSDISQYSNDLLYWTLAFFGCPAQPSVDSGSFQYGLIPRSLASHVFTTADLQLLSSFYVQAVQQAITVDQGLPDLTATQYAQINAQLAAWAAEVPDTQPSSVYSFGSCATDAGTESSSSDAADSGDADQGG